MSNEVTTLTLRPHLAAGAKPTAIVPTDMESAYRLANAVCSAGMAPKGLDTPEKALVAILHGLEIGLTPMAALQRIAVVNGRPTIWGDGAIGLVRGSGLCEWIKETIEGDGDARVAVCEAKRRGEPESIKRTFSVKDAKQASLWGKAGPWQQYSERMLQMRARAFCLRDGFADVLGGLYLREEIDEDHAVSRRAPAPTPVAAIEHAPVVEMQPIEAETVKEAVMAEAEASAPVQRRAPAPVSEAPRSNDALDFEAIYKRFGAAAKAAEDIDQLNDAWERIVSPVESELFPPDRDELASLHRKRERELEP